MKQVTDQRRQVEPPRDVEGHVQLALGDDGVAVRHGDRHQHVPRHHEVGRAVDERRDRPQRQASRLDEPAAADEQLRSDDVDLRPRGAVAQLVEREGRGGERGLGVGVSLEPDQHQPHPRPGAGRLEREAEAVELRKHRFVLGERLAREAEDRLRLGLLGEEPREVDR